MNRAALLSLALPVLLAGCVEDVGAGKVAATVAEPAEAAPVVAAEEARSVAIDTAASRVHALGAKVTGKHDIVFDRWDGNLQVAGGSVVGLDVTIAMESINADHPKLTGHLKSPDFFDVANFPTATFTSSSVAPRPGADGVTHFVNGTLTLRGVPKDVGFPATISTESGATRAHAEFVIDRQDFGIAYPGKPDDLIQDNVVLTIDLVAPSGATRS